MGRRDHPRCTDGNSIRVCQTSLSYDWDAVKRTSLPRSLATVIHGPFCPGNALALSWLTLRKASSTASGCRAITASRTRAGPSGRVRPCSQFRKVAGWKPNFAAKAAWLRPRCLRVSRTSIVGTSTVETRTATSMPSTQSTASWKLAIYPAVSALFPNLRLVVTFLFIESSLSCIRRPGCSPVEPKIP
jgi:hypothetical protein